MTQHTSPTTLEALINAVVEHNIKDDPLNPWSGRKEHAKKELAVQCLTQIFGKDHPLPRIAQASVRIDRNLYPAHLDYDRLSTAEVAYDDMLEAWDQLDNETTDKLQQTELLLREA